MFFFFKNIHFVQIYAFLEFLNMLSPFNFKGGIFWIMSFLEKIIFGKNHDFFQWFTSDIYRIFINDIYQLINIIPTLIMINCKVWTFFGVLVKSSGSSNYRKIKKDHIKSPQKYFWNTFFIMLHIICSFTKMLKWEANISGLLL